VTLARARVGGLGIGAVLPEVAVLSAWTLGAFALALYLYRWQ